MWRATNLKVTLAIHWQGYVPFLHRIPIIFQHAVIGKGSAFQKEHSPYLPQKKKYSARKLLSTSFSVGEHGLSHT